MSLKKARVLLVGLLLVIGVVGCGENPAPPVHLGPVPEPESVAEPKPVAEPEPATEPEPVVKPKPGVETVAKPEPVAEQAKQSPPGRR